jgi:predicted Zn-dependent peptidase
MSAARHRCWLLHAAALWTLLWLDVAAASGVTLPDATRIGLPNGTVLVLTEKHDVPLVAVQAMLRGGAVADPLEKNGLASLYASLLEKGAGKRDAAEFSAAVDSVGGQLVAGAGLESITISGEFLARDARLMVELLADMLIRPTLDREELDKLRERTINMIRAAKDSDPNGLMSTYARGFLFGAHPYGNPVEGSETSLANISHADITRYLTEQVGADRLIVSVAGDFDSDEMLALLRAAFADWRAAAMPLPEITAATADEGGRVLLIDKPGATQTYFWIGNIGVERDYAQRADLDIANTVFGGRFTSMLNTALRVDSGLTYGASAQLIQPSKPGAVGIRSYTQTESTVAAIDLAVSVLGRLQDSGIDDVMLASARNYVLGQFPTSLETAAQLAAAFAELAFFGLDADFVNGYGAAVEAVDGASVMTVIDAVYPARDQLVYVLLGDADLIRAQVGKYGAVTELPISAPHFRPQ